jgi:hypothetical protein
VFKGFSPSGTKLLEGVMNFVRNICLIIAAVFVASPVVAAPAALMNKTITVAYATTIPGKKADGSPVSGSRVSVRTIYISSAGRIFARIYRRDGGKSEQKDAGPSDSGNTLRFAGDKLVGVMKFPSGAAQMTISFDAGGQSCSADIVAGRENGQALRWKGVDGMMREATGAPTFSNISCSITAGNAFSG